MPIISKMVGDRDSLYTTRSSSLSSCHGSCSTTAMLCWWAYPHNRLQSVRNAAARSIAGLRRSDHITDTLASFHWSQSVFILATIVYRSVSFTERLERHGSSLPGCRSAPFVCYAVQTTSEIVTH